MKITFESVQEHNIQGRNSAERPHASMQDTMKKAERTGAYSVNIGGREGRMQKEGTYKKEALTAEEISMQASQMDMDVQGMYMAVMSNSMSQDDFNKMLEDGYSVSDVDIETMVTILDQIKVAVAKGGGEIAGYTDDLSKETLEEILGSSAYAEALESGLEEGAAAYMVEQQMSPTAENIYKAKYSAGAYQGERNTEIPDMEEEDGKAFWEQIDKVIRDAGLPQNAESREDAAFLLRHDIPLTEENLQLYEKVKAFEKNGQRLSEEELKYRIAMQAYEGKEAHQADLSREVSIYEQAADILEEVQELTAEAVEQAVEKKSEGKELTLKDLMEEQKSIEQAVGEQRKEVSDEAVQLPEKEVQNGELLMARRQLEEVRLRMTIEANIRLLRSGFQIDTAPMEQLIEQLKQAEEALAGQGISQTAEAVEKLNELRIMPASTLGYVVNREISFTIETLHEKGSELQADIEKANADKDKVKQEVARERYETMQTTPRADMGDSIRKAFRNVDDILADLNREPSEENRRAVRILGYNRLEITEENLERALDVDQKVQNLFRDLKPGKVLQMIRDGVDVLHADIDELDAYLSAQKNEFAEESENFARFLHKLDRNGGITAEERESYIGIYRLVRQVEKADGKAEGYLLGSEAQLTMENLLKAVRSGKKGYMDYKIDERFSGVDALQRGKSIVDQINTAPYENTRGYEETMQALEGAGRKAGQAENAAAEFLKEMNQPVTISNLLEASAVLQEDAGIYQKIEDYENKARQEDKLEAEQNRLEGYVMDLQEAVGEEASLQESMEVFAKQVEEVLQEAEEQDGVTELDIRDIQRLYKGLQFRTALSKESHYQIPVKLEEHYTVMNLTVRRGTGEAQAEISMKTEEYGRLEAVFTESSVAGSRENADTRVRGSLFAETENGVELLREMTEKIKERLWDEGISTEDMTVMQGNRIRKGTSYEPADGTEGEEDSSRKAVQKEISTGELYQIAKIFLETIRK